MTPPDLNKDIEEQRDPLVSPLIRWLFAPAILIMSGSGWHFYNDVPILPFTFPVWVTLGGNLQYSSDQHGELDTANAIWWLLVASVAIYAAHGIVSGRFRRDFLPVGPGAGSDAAATRRVMMPGPERLHVPDGSTAASGRRRLLGRSRSPGALAMLTGRDISDSNVVRRSLKAILRWNDMVQAVLFSDNASYRSADVSKLDADSYCLSLTGAIEDKHPRCVSDFVALRQKSPSTRHIHVEGWGYTGQWGDPALASLSRPSLSRPVGAHLASSYVGYECADGYDGGMDMATVLHPQILSGI